MAATLTIVTPQGREIRAELSSLLTPDLREAVRVEANAWIKRLRLVTFDGRSMRECFTYRGDSLWWFTELYLHKERRIDAAVAATLALDAAREQHGGARFVVSTDDVAVRDAAKAFGLARDLAIEIDGSALDTRRPSRDSYLIGLTAHLSRLRPAERLRGPRARVAAFVHTAFWRPTIDDDGPGQESYIGPVLSAVATRLGSTDLRYVGVGPRQNFRARRWWDPVTPGAARPLITPIERLSRRRDLQGSLDIWSRRHELARALTSGDAIRAAGTFRGVDLWPILRRELEGAALLQWPWSARAMDESSAAIDAIAPETIVTYAEAGGWGRALMLEARRRGVRSIGLQHGFIYRHWLNYTHEADEMKAAGDDRGFPAPDRTLLFDGYACEWLASAGHFPPASLVVTGNPGLDGLARRMTPLSDADRQQIRRTLGVADDRRVLAFAAKFSEASSSLAGLAAAVRAHAGDVHLVIKTHPAETPEVYAATFAGMSNVTIAPASTDLARVLAITDAIVTVNSTVAIDALVLGIPALVLGLPNNLSPFVSAGVMLGTRGDEEVGRQLEALLYDDEARRRLAGAASRFAAEHGMRTDGRAAERAADEILTSR